MANAADARKAEDIADLCQQASGPDRPESGDGIKGTSCCWQSGNVLGNRAVHGPQLALQRANRRQGRGQDQLERLIQSWREPVGISSRLLEGRGDLARISKPPPPVLLDKGRQIFQRGLSQLFGGKGLQHPQTGGAKQIVEGRLPL